MDRIINIVLSTLILMITTNDSMAIDSDVLEANIDALSAQLLTCKDMVGFSVGVVKDGQPLLTKGYGFSNLEKDTLVTENTVFGIASLSKAFTATLLTYLVQQHSEYTLDTPVKTILGPDFYFATEQLTKWATIRDLLTHRTGIPPYNTARMQEDLTRENLMKKIRFFQPTYEFRSQYRYNNNMYGLLSKVTEVVGGDSWENLIRKHIFVPLGMNSSTFTHETNMSSEHIALAYRRDWSRKSGWRPMSALLHSEWGQSGGSGSIMSTAVDLIRWLQFQLSLGKDSRGNQVMPESVVTETRTPFIVIPEAQCWTCPFYTRPYLNVTYVRNTYGLGWRVGLYRGERLVTHTGSSWGYTGLISLLPDSGIAVHTSVTGSDMYYEGRKALHAYIMDLLLGVEPQVTVENACSFPYYDRNTTQQRSAWSYDDSLPTKVPPPTELDHVRPYLGMYGNFGFGNVTVEYNESLQMLQLKYGVLGLWDMFAKNDSGVAGEFRGEGREHVWPLILDPLVFRATDNSGKMTHLTVEYFEPSNPPVFERGLKFADAPPPEQGELVCSSGWKVEITFWLALCLVSFPQICYWVRL